MIRRSVVVAYSLAMFACAAMIVAVGAGDPPAAAAAPFVVVGVLQPTLSRRTRPEWVAAGQHVTELVLFAVVVPFAPDAWQVAAVWMGVRLTWYSIATPRRFFVPALLATIVVMSIVGASSGVEAWPLAVVSAAIGAGVFTVLGVTLRREIHQNESALVETLAAAGAIVHHADLDAGTIVRLEGDVEGITGWTPAEWSHSFHRDFVHPDDVDDFWLDADDIEPDTIVDRLARIRCRDGSWIWLRDVVRVTFEDDGGRYLRGFALDVTELVEANVQIAEQARRDPLTGLANRLALTDRVDQLLLADARFALLIVDLDRFKEVNDTLGHEAGDHLLRVMAERLRQIVGENGLLARLGGDEFAIVAEYETTDAVHDLLRLLSSASSRPLDVRGVRLAVSSSTGVALSDGSDRATLMRHADIAMYEAKRRGSGSCVFDASLERTSTMQLTLSAALPAAVASGEIGLHFQPKFDLADRRMIGAEGLARWEHPELGLLTPAAFLDVTLVSEYAVPFALRTIDGAAAAIRRLADAGHPMPIAANVAISALRDVDFGDAVLERLAAHGADPSLLTIELTESEVLGPSGRMTAVFDQLTSAGITLSIDDFGTGHSSLERLRVLDVGELKIDRSFVSGMGRSPLDRKIVETIIGLADRLGCGLVAEGVETDEQARVLLELGCPTAQGYLYARPMPFAELLGMVERLGRGDAAADELTTITAASSSR